LVWTHSSLFTAESMEEEIVSRNVAPIIGLHAHGWDDEPTVPLSYTSHTMRQLQSRDERGNWPRSTATWQNNIGWGGGWGSRGNDSHTTNGWETDILTDSDIWSSSTSDPMWAQTSEHQVWPSSNSTDSSQYPNIWEDPALNAERWPHLHGVPPNNNNAKSNTIRSKITSWQEYQISELRSHNMFLEQLNKLLTQHLTAARDHETLAKEIEEHLVQKMQQNEILEQKLLNSNLQITKLNEKLEEQQKLSLTEKLNNLSILDLEEVNLQTQELILKKKRDQRESRLCVVCIDKERTNVVTPCGHFCLCECCVVKLPPPIKCPVCRGDARDIFRVFT